MNFNSIVPQVMNERSNERARAENRAQENANQSVGMIQQGFGALANSQEGERQYQRQQSELDRPLEAPVSDLLNRLSAKVKSRELPGKTAAYLFQLFKAGRISPDQMEQALGGAGGGDGSLPPIPTMAGDSQAAPVGGMSLPGGNGAPPIAIKNEVTAPQSMDNLPMAAPGTPPQRITPSPTFSGVPEAAPQARNIPPPPPPSVAPSGPVGGMVPQQQSVPLPGARPARESTPDNYQWTQRGLNQLHQAGGYPPEPRKTELDYVSDALKTINNNVTKSNIAGGKVEQDKAALKAHMDRWNADRQQAWQIAMARINALKQIAGTRGDATRDVKLLSDARSAVKTLRDNDTKLRSSIGTLAQDPTVMQQIQQNEQLIQDAEKRVVEAEARVKAALGETTVIAPDGKPSPQGATAPKTGSSLVDEFMSTAYGE